MNAEASRTPVPMPRPQAAPDRPGKNASPVAANTLAGRFAAQLDKQGGGAEKTGEQPRSAVSFTASLLGDGKQPLTAKEDSSQDQGQWAGTASGAAPGFAPAMPAQAARGEVALPDMTLLDRIAAQIAEPHGADGKQAVQLALPPGSLAAEALVSRGTDGGLAIRISGLDPRLQPSQTLRLRSGLEKALARRGVEVTSLALEQAGPESNQRGRAAVTSRVV